MTDRTGADRQRRYIAKLKAAAAQGQAQDSVTNAELTRLREENAALRQRLEEAQAHTAAAPGKGTGMLSATIKRLMQENTLLKKQLADARAANPGIGPADEAAAGRLARENERLEETVAQLEARLAADPGEVGKLVRQLKGARTRIRNLERVARSRGLVMSKADRRKVRRALHPDHEQDSNKKRLLEEAFQIFEALPIEEAS